MVFQEERLDQDEKPQDEHPEPSSAARVSASLRMVGLAVGVIAGMVVGVTLDSILLGVALGIGIGVGAAALLDRLSRPRTP